ncbi:MAG: T9SS type A sorting domain-containing protein [bacterium]|nr:T9SS type A sorting domain-containing protein [bacterium]
MKMLKLATLCLILLTVAGSALAVPANQDTTWVMTFDEEFVNWATPHTQEFTFPSNPERYSEVLLYITIGCPGYPGDCDPWDRYAWLRLIEDLGGDETRDVEIARFITPYDITGPPTYPQSCQWVYDVTDYKFMLKDLATLKLYIESWMGNDKGWLITANFAFVHGATALQPFEIVNLYLKDHIIYGNSPFAHEENLLPVGVTIPNDAVAAKVRMTTTGHGFGFAQNCAEFCPKVHSLVVDDNTFSHTLWNQCSTNPCSPQGGTWTYSRAGWCPGDKVTPWDNDITHLLTPGEEMILDYNIAEYFNPCNPTNPDCVAGVTCSDCNYNGTTPPNWKVMGQLILYRADLTGVDTPITPQSLNLEQNYPNPFNPVTTIYYEIEEPGHVSLRIFSAGGREVLTIERDHPRAGRFWFQWDGTTPDGERMTSGVYFYEVQTEDISMAKKMILLQ